MQMNSRHLLYTMNDISKKQMRSDKKNARGSLDPKIKNQMDKMIFDNLLSIDKFKKAEFVLVYISTQIEVDTKEIIEYCLETDKKVAVPKCIENYKMDFYLYNAETPMEVSGYGISEPIADESCLVNNFDADNTVCIVPGLSYDKSGYRLGYGGGYYDRFLSEHQNITTIGLCYSSDFMDKLITDKYDIAVDYVVTEKFTEVCNGK